MTLSKSISKLLYMETPGTIPENYADIVISCSEQFSGNVQVKQYPLMHGEHLFVSVWDIHDGNKLSATAIPSKNFFRYDCELQSGMRTTLHSHEYMEMFYVAEGEYRQRILEEEYVFRKGEMGLIDQNCVHQEIFGKGDAKVIFLGVTNVMFNEIMNRGVMTERIASFMHAALKGRKTLQQYLHFMPINGDCQAVEDCLVNIIDELIKNDVASGIICQGLLLRLFRLLSVKYEFELSKQYKRKSNFLLLEEITEYMRENIRHMSVAMLSEKFHFQEDYFNRFIKGLTGLTYTEYLQSLRLREAENMLIKSDKSVEEIVKIVGYKNKGYFYKIFEEQHRQTPVQFRKKFMEQNKC